MKYIIIKDRGKPILVTGHGTDDQMALRWQIRSLALFRVWCLIGKGKLTIDCDRSLITVWYDNSLHGPEFLGILEDAIKKAMVIWNMLEYKLEFKGLDYEKSQESS